MIYKQKFKYDYHLIKSSWGISISFFGNLVSNEKTFESVNNIVKYTISNKISNKEKRLLVKGIQLFCSNCTDSIFIEQIICFDSLAYNLCDYQDEGLVAGTIECLSYLSGLSLPDINVFFDKSKNKYCYCLNGKAL